VRRLSAGSDRLTILLMMPQPTAEVWPQALEPGFSHVEAIESSVRMSGVAPGSNKASTTLPRASINLPIRFAKSSGKAWPWRFSVIMVSILRFNSVRAECRRLFTVATVRPRNVAMSWCEHSWTKNSIAGSRSRVGNVESVASTVWAC